MKKLFMISTLFLLSFQIYARPSEEEMQAIKACEQELGIERPARPKRGQRPSEEEHEKMKANMDKIKACLSEKGIELPERRSRD